MEFSQLLLSKNDGLLYIQKSRSLHDLPKVTRKAIGLPHSPQQPFSRAREFKTVSLLPELQGGVRSRVQKSPSSAPQTPASRLDASEHPETFLQEPLPPWSPRSIVSMVVQWLRLCLSMQGVWVQFLVSDLRSHKPCSQETKTQNRSNIVTSSIKTLKMTHIKKSFLKK